MFGELSSDSVTDFVAVLTVANCPGSKVTSIISFCVGWVVLALFAEGLLRLIGVIPPLLPWLQITLK